MSTTQVSNLLHVCFSTKHREDLIPRERFPDLAAYIGGICRKRGCALLCFGGMPNHVHMLVVLSKNIAFADLMLHIKRDSSVLLRKEVSNFGWQDGYFGFSIGESQIPVTRAYMERQEQHHKSRDYRDEMRAFCKRHGLEINEKYAWD